MIYIQSFNGFNKPLCQENRDRINAAPAAESTSAGGWAGECIGVSAGKVNGGLEAAIEIVF